MGTSGVPLTGQQFVAATPPSTPGSSSAQLSSSSALYTAGQTRTGYTRDNSLRSSASLQDFSALRNGSSSTGVARTTSLSTGFGSVLSNQAASRNDGASPALTPIKSNILRRSSGSLAFVTYNTSSFCTRRAVLALAFAFFGALLFLGVLWGTYGLSQDGLEYAVVIDSGSTGTRVYVYGWTRDGLSGRESLPVMLKPARPVEAVTLDGAPAFEKGNRRGDSRLYNRMETEPGLDKLLHNESGVAKALEPLLSWAGKQIPRAAQRKAKLFFLATAGLRRLHPEDSKWLLDRAFTSLERSPFMARREWVRLISGQEEAYYGWIALNYNLRRLGHPSKLPSFGALDLGGSSLEVTFEPVTDASRVENAVNVTVGAIDHHLYAQSHSGFGLNDAFEKSVALLIQSRLDSRKDNAKRLKVVSHPCLNAGYRRPYVCSSQCQSPSNADAHAYEPRKGRRRVLLASSEPGFQVELVGEPDWKKCQNLVERVINTSMMVQSAQGTDCGQAPCALGKYQPQAEGEFVALAGFFVVFKFFGLTSANSLVDLLDKGQSFCNLKWEEAEQSVISQPSIDRYCFRAPYTVALLRQGLHLRDDQVTIGSGDFAWTLGAALNEAGALNPLKVRDGKTRTFTGLRQPSFRVDGPTLTFLLVVVIIAILLLTGVGRWLATHHWRRPYLPLFVTPAAGRWFPNVFHSKNGSASPAAPNLPGESWMKQQHSPAPFAIPRSFQHQMFESGDKHAGGDGPVLECDVLQRPSATGTATVGGPSRIQLATLKMQQVNGARLQSRRSQSREDLSAYTPPEILLSKVKGSSCCLVS